MIAELGKYAGTVLAAYGVTALLLGGIGLVSLLHSLRVRRNLEKLEAARNGGARDRL